MARQVLSGNAAQSYAVRLARVPVISAYPITPQTSIVEHLAEFVADGTLPAKFIKVESEHSALMAVVSASALGVRTYTATSSQGLLLMHELLHWAAGLRAPVVMGVVNRAVAPPWNIGADHTDTVSQRDTGWIQFYAESNQEVLDTVLVAYRLAEDAVVRLPAMVTEDAFYLSHTVEPVDVPEPGVVDAFLPPREPVAVLRPDTGSRLGSFTGPVEYVEFRRAVSAGLEQVPGRLAEIEAEFQDRTGRDLGGMMPLYRTEDADAVLVTMGTATSTARTVVDEMRTAGQKVGLAKLRVFRPFPTAQFRQLAGCVDRIGVVDRSATFGGLGAAATEARAAIYPTPHRPILSSFLAGIGGRDVTPAVLRGLFERLLSGESAEPTWADLPSPPGEVVHG